MGSEYSISWARIPSKAAYLVLLFVLCVRTPCTGSRMLPDGDPRRATATRRAERNQTTDRRAPRSNFQYSPKPSHGGELALYASLVRCTLPLHYRALRPKVLRSLYCAGAHDTRLEAVARLPQKSRTPSKALFSFVDSIVSHIVSHRCSYSPNFCRRSDGMWECVGRCVCGLGVLCAQPSQVGDAHVRHGRGLARRGKLQPIHIST